MLCFGKREAMKDLLPERRKRLRERKIEKLPPTPA